MRSGEAPIRKLGSLARKVAVWAWISAGFQIAVSAFSLIEVIHLFKLPLSNNLNILDSVMGTDLVLAAGIVAVAMAVVFIVSAILSLRWIYLANANAHRFASGLTISPAWNVGWFFVPIASFFKPFQGIEQVWRSTNDPNDWHESAIPRILRWWWGFWLVTGFFAWTSFRLELVAQTVEGRLASDIADILSPAFVIPATILFLRIVGEVSSVQDSAAEES